MSIFNTELCGNPTILHEVNPSHAIIHVQDGLKGAVNAGGFKEGLHVGA
jgi:hypothetical protein